jgi:hypothetical protein
MTEPGSSSDPAADLEREADQLERHLEQLDDHIADAQKTAAARREEAIPEAAAGDWEDTKGTPGQGEDPEGAVDDDAPAASGDDSAATAPERDDPVGSRMPGHASGGDD